jgi:hypothetical protein
LQPEFGSNDLKRLHPVAYNSRKLTAAEINYPVYKKELLAIKYALQTWRIYVDNGHTTVIYTDHKSLKYLATMRNLSKRLARRIEEFGEYDLDIQYQKRSEAVVPDAIIRPKLTDLDCLFWLAPRPLYVSQIRAWLNFGSASIRLHLYRSGSFLISSVPYPVLYLLPAHTPLLPLPNRYGPRKRPLEVIGNFTRAASPDERMRLTWKYRGGPELGSVEGLQIRTFERLRNRSVRQNNSSI